jgi:hypothetical protein
VTFAVELPIEPDAIRRARAESDVVTGEIMNKPVSLDEALRVRARESVSGTISVAFETDPGGSARRRTKVTRLHIAGPDGRTETKTVTETLERRLISRRD